MKLKIKGWVLTKKTSQSLGETPNQVMRSLGVGKFGTVKVGSFSTHR